MARITVPAPRGEQLAFDLYPTADPSTVAVWDADTTSPQNVSAWLERRTKPGTKGTTEWRPAWLNGTRRAVSHTWWPTRRRALESLLHQRSLMALHAEPAAPEVLDRRDVSGLDLELTPGATPAFHFATRAGRTVGIVQRVALGYWQAENTAGTWRGGAWNNRRAALESLAAHLAAPALEPLTEHEALEAVAELATHPVPEVLRSYSGATVPVLGTPITAAECTATSCPDHDPGPVPAEDEHRRRAARTLRLQLDGAQEHVHELLEDRARLAYRMSMAGLSQPTIGEDLGVSRQMVARLITRGHELCGHDVYPEPIAAPPAG